jgi:hypothetical protein
MAGTLAAVVVIGAAAVAGLLVWRAAKRRYRLVRNHAAAQTAVALWGVASSLEARRLLSGDVRGLVTLRASRRMWRAVALAERGVGHAQAAGAAVGDLPALCRRLRSVATDVDHQVQLEAAAGSPGRSEPVRRQVDDVLDAAHDIARAASVSVGEVTGPRAAELADDADREIRALSAGLARARQLAD